MSGMNYQARQYLVNELSQVTQLTEAQLTKLYDDFMIKSGNTGNIGRQDLVKTLMREPGMRLPQHLAEKVRQHRMRLS